MGTLHEDRYKFWLYLAHFFLEWGMFQIEGVKEFKTHILCSITSYRKSRHLCDNMEKYFRAAFATDDNIMRYMRITCCVTKATNTLWEYVRVILTAFSLQQWFYEGASELPNAYLACLAN